MRVFTYSVAGLLAAIALACATAGPSSSAPARSYTYWSGTLQPTQQRTRTLAVPERQRAYGTVELTVAPRRSTRTRARVTISTPVEPGATGLRWAIHEGSCGSGTPPLMPVELFPMIELSASGQGSIDVEIPLEMPKFGTYHVNVFRGTGTQLDNVLTCGNLRGHS